MICQSTINKKQTKSICTFVKYNTLSKDYLKG